MDSPCAHVEPNFCCRKLKALQKWKRKREEKDEQEEQRKQKNDTDARAYYNDTEAGQGALERVCSRVMKPLNGGRLVAYHMPHPLGEHKLYLTLVTDKTADWAMDGPYRWKLGEQVIVNIPQWFLDRSVRLH